jgi:hypothetical protein
VAFNSSVNILSNLSKQLVGRGDVAVQGC